MDTKRNAYEILVVKPEGKRPLRRFCRRWEENMDVTEIVCDSVWIGFIWLRIGTGGGLL
jgi:hypothetical protein